MPIYEYKCKKGHSFDVIQKFSDEPVKKCEQCGAPAERVFSPPAVHFKGSGFYNTDYGKQKRGKSGGGGGGESEKSKSSSSSDSSSSSSSSDSSASKTASSKKSD